jgi:hypothetical protein
LIVVEDVLVGVGVKEVIEEGCIVELLSIKPRPTFLS